MAMEDDDWIEDSEESEDEHYAHQANDEDDRTAALADADDSDHPIDDNELNNASTHVCASAAVFGFSRIAFA